MWEQTVQIDVLRPIICRFPQAYVGYFVRGVPH
jgi:hypothetical protein